MQREEINVLYITRNGNIDSVSVIKGESVTIPVEHIICGFKTDKGELVNLTEELAESLTDYEILLIEKNMISCSLIGGNFTPSRVYDYHNANKMYITVNGVTPSLEELTQVQFTHLVEGSANVFTAQTKVENNRMYVDTTYFDDNWNLWQTFSYWLNGTATTIQNFPKDTIDIKNDTYNIVTA